MQGEAVQTERRHGALPWLRSALGAAGALIFVALLLGGFFHGLPGWAQVGVMCLQLGLLLPAVSWRLRELPAGRPARGAVETPLGLLRDLEFGTLLLLIAHTFVQISGSLGQELYPLIYLLLAFLTSFHSRRVGMALVAMAIGLELGLWLGGYAPGAQGPLGAGRLALRCVLLALFGAAHMLFLQVELRRQQHLHLSQLEAERAALRAQARDLRLDSAPLSEERDMAQQLQLEEGLLQDAVQALGSSAESTLRMLHTGLGCHTVALLWMDEEGQRLRLRAGLHESGALVSTLHPGEGALAGVIRRREPINLKDLRPEYRGLTYYQQGSGVVRSFLGVPVMQEQPREDGEPVLLGLLCLDRSEKDRPFRPEEERLAQEAAASIVRALQTEQLFLTMERAHFELGRFYEASRQLGQALTPAQVYDAALACAWDICQQDLAAVVLTEEEHGVRHHRVARVESYSQDAGWTQAAARLEGLRFGDNQGLVSMATRLRHTLPYRGQYRQERSVVFTPEIPLPDAQSLVVLPLVAQEREVGTLVLAHREPNLFVGKRRVLLEVIAQQVAISVANARMYAQMEQMATTDALTGLTNRGTFNQKLVEVIARSERGAGDFSLLLTDIDHFKKINDTYGHPVGDEVLRQVAATFREVLRQTDIPARYGGEEFVVVLEATPLEGATLIAERLRRAVGKLRFESPKGNFHISMSFGVATWPHDADHPELLIEHADQALYFAKRNGRNQVKIWSQLPAQAA